MKRRDMAKFYLTAERLRAHGACQTGVARFVKLFGEGKVMVHERNAQIALAAGLPMWWLAVYYLPQEKYRLIPYGASDRYYWEQVKAHMETDNAERPVEWY